MGSRRNSVSTKTETNALIERLDAMEKKLCGKIDSKINDMNDVWNKKFESILQKNDQILEQFANFEIETKNQFKTTNSRIDNAETDIQALKQEGKTSKNDIYRLEYLFRMNQLNISNVPEEPDEDLVDIFQKMVNGLKITGPIVLDSIYRAGKKSNQSDVHRLIIVNFLSVSNRNVFFAAYHQCKTMDLNFIGFTGNTTRIYINEYLSPELRKVHSIARRLMKTGKLQKVIKRDGLIYVKSQNQPDLVQVNTPECLKLFIN